MSYQWTNEDRLEFKVSPLDQASTIPAHWYTDPGLLEIEKSHLFYKGWQYVGHVGQAANPGDHFVAEILSQPLVIVRQASGELRCFANVCRHRGGPLATESGSSRILRCRYHAWTYSLDGELIGTPKFDSAVQFNRKECSLPQFRLEDYEGFLFVNLSGTASPLQDQLAGIQETVAPLKLLQMRFQKRVVYTVKCNWKIYVDNFMEGYHILPVHPGLAKMLDVSRYTTSVEGNKVLQTGPLNSSDNPFKSGGSAFYYQVFPNLMFNVLPGRVQINSILPVDTGNCLTVFDFFYDACSPETLDQRVCDDLEMSDLVQREDIEICERVQKGISSGSYYKGRLCPAEEMGIWAFQNQLRQSFQAVAEL